MSTRIQFSIGGNSYIIWWVHSGESNKDICRDLNYLRLTVGAIWENHEIIVKPFTHTNFSAKRLRTNEHTDLEETLFAWFEQQIAQNVPKIGQFCNRKPTSWDFF